jgi:hypothetical protein
LFTNRSIFFFFFLILEIQNFFSRCTSIKKTFFSSLKKQRMPVIVILGGAGTGKTTFAKNLRALWPDSCLYDEKVGDFYADVLTFSKTLSEHHVPQMRENIAFVGSVYLGRFRGPARACIFVTQCIGLTHPLGRLMIDQADLIFNFPGQSVSPVQGRMTECTQSWKLALAQQRAAEGVRSADAAAAAARTTTNTATVTDATSNNNVAADRSSAFARSMLDALPLAVDRSSTFAKAMLDALPLAGPSAPTVNTLDKNENPLPPASQIFLPPAACPYEPYSDAHLDHLLRETAAYLRKMKPIRKGDGNSTTIVVPTDNFCVVPPYKIDDAREFLAYDCCVRTLKRRFCEQGYLLTINSGGCLHLDPLTEVSDRHG